MADRRKNSHMILYRGSLKSCNYRCSYCPFSKRAMSKGELEKDEEQWDSFVRSLAEKGHALGVGALMVVPYGEALIHPWYWEGFVNTKTRTIILQWKNETCEFEKEMYI